MAKYIEEEDDDDDEEVTRDNSYSWERIRGFLTEHEIDARWILRKEGDSRAHGNLRIVNHRDLKPGYLRAFWTLVTSRKQKTKKEIDESIDLYQMEEIDLEIYSVNEHITTDTKIIEESHRTLENMFNVKIFEDF